MSDFLGSTPERLVDQILVFHARRAAEPVGVSADAKFAASGAYRVRSVSLRKPETGGREAWIIEPYADGWTRFPFPKIGMPNATSLGFKYVRELRKNLLQDLLQEAVDSVNAKSLPANFELADLQRLKHFAEMVPEWSKVAARKAEAFSESIPPRVFSAPSARSPVNTLLGEQLGRLKAVIRTVPERSEAADETAVPLDVDQAPEPVLSPPAASTEPKSAEHPVQQESVEGRGGVDEGASEVRERSEPALKVLLPEPALLSGLTGQFGADVVQQLRVGFGTKPIVVLAGPPGMGKSWLATHLLDDDQYQRGVVISVGSTWRGREDFLGYVNPVSNEFEPSAFTSFLVDAERAWRDGDRRPRLAVLEEFNLSQPEHWLSDFLVASQFPADQVALRTIELGGSGMRGETARRSVYLSPAVRIVATVNNDHTTRPLSPRVLDRAAAVEVRSAVKSIVKLVELPLDDDQLAALEEVDAVLSSSGAGFSMRTALSIREAFALLAGEGEASETYWKSIDFVLLQEMLSKVRLLANEPRDLQLLEDLDAWASGQYGSRLNACGARIADWKSRYAAGADISMV